jgi:hypothetical protein
MTDVLHELIETAAAVAQKQFLAQGHFSPVWHMVTADGEHLFSGPISHDKDTQVAMLKALMIIRKVVRYVFIDEAWILERKCVDRAEIDRAYEQGIKNHPDRKEILMITGEDQTLGMLMARCDIIRERGKVRLGPLVIDKFDGMEGRMVGLLPALGARQ